MKVLMVIASMLVTVILGATNPTTVCLPDKLQINLFNSLLDLSGVAYLDFPNDAVAIIYSNNIRKVYKISDFSGATINETTGECRKHEAIDILSNLITKCLSDSKANVVEVTNTSLYIGTGHDSTDIQVFRISLPGVGTIRYIFTRTDPAIPILQDVKYDSNPQTYVIFFTNPQLVLSDQSVFDVPDDCTSGTSAG